MTYHRSELYGSYTAAALALEEAFNTGWRIDPKNPPEQVAFSYALILIRDDEPEIKLTRAEILTKARAAKIIKKQEEPE